MPNQENKPKLNPDFIRQFEFTNKKTGKKETTDFVVYQGILDLAHQIGIKSLVVTELQRPHPDNNMIAICKATLISNDGRTFEDIADADVDNVGLMVKGAIIRMASTRAKARVLRDFTNIGITCFEELNPDTLSGTVRPDNKSYTKPSETKEHSDEPDTDEEMISEKQIQEIRDFYSHKVPEKDIESLSEEEKEEMGNVVCGLTSEKAEKVIDNFLKTKAPRISLDTFARWIGWER